MDSTPWSSLMGCGSLVVVVVNLKPSQIHVQILSTQTDIFNSMEDKI
jgi:hypothetical protein